MPVVKAASNETPKRVQEQVDTLFRKVASEQVKHNASSTRVYAAYALFKDAGSSFDVLKRYGITEMNGRNKILSQFYALAPDQLGLLCNDLVQSIVSERSDHSMGSGSEMVDSALCTLVAHKVDMLPMWNLDADFLKGYTKKGIEALMAEAGFDKWYDEKHTTEKTKTPPFGALMKSKTDDLIAGILKSGFDFSQFLPACIGDRMKKAQTQFDELQGKVKPVVSESEQAA